MPPLLSALLLYVENTHIENFDAWEEERPQCAKSRICTDASSGVSRSALLYICNSAYVLSQHYIFFHFYSIKHCSAICFVVVKNYPLDV